MDHILGGKKGVDINKSDKAPGCGVDNGLELLTVQK